MPGPANAVAARPTEERATDALFGRVTERYRTCGRPARGYVSAKLHGDPVHRAILGRAARFDFGRVVDVGCGRGQLGIALLEAGLARSVLGLDRSAAHLGQARRAARGLAFAAELRDLSASPELPEADTVLIVDVLYQLAPETQRALLRAAARAGRRHLVIRTLDPARGWRSVVTLGVERIGLLLSPDPGRHVSPLPIPLLLGLLRDLGFRAEVAPCWTGTPFANVLVTATREQPRSRRALTPSRGGSAPAAPR